MPERTVASYGSWRSPISSDLIVRDAVGLSSIAVDGSDVYWLESRPGEGGRNVVVLRTPEGRTEDVTPQPFNARTRVHEYGGGDFAVHEGTLYFSNFADQRIYRQAPGGQPQPLTPEGGKRYADMVVDKGRRRLIAVREDHTGPGREPVNEIVSVDLEERRRDRARLRQRLLLLAAPEPGRTAPRLADVEPPEHALGRHGAHGL